MAGVENRSGMTHHFEVECWKAGAHFKNGKLKKYAQRNPEKWMRWHDEFDNLVTTAGLNKYLDATLKTGLAAPAWYVGLKDTGTPDAADTLSSHATWAELTSTVYTGDRPAWTPGSISAGSVSNSGSKAQFTITGGDTIYGALLCDAASGTSGTLLGVGDFTGGSRAVIIGDRLDVTVTATITAA